MYSESGPIGHYLISASAEQFVVIFLSQSVSFLENLNIRFSSFYVPVKYIEEPRISKEKASMARQPNTTVSGASFDPSTINAVWDKAKEDRGFTTYKKDECGETIRKSEYGKTDKYGWEIDHTKPVSAGGTDNLSNLQPHHWENNRHKGDS